MKDTRRKFFDSLLGNAEKCRIPKKVIQTYIDQVTNRFEVK